MSEPASEPSAQREPASEPSAQREPASEPSAQREPASGPSAQGEPRVTVYTRAGCHLCETAEQVVERICAELGHAWRAVDVDTDPVLRAEYGDQVPVIMVDGREHGFWRVEEGRFRAALS